MDTFEPWLEWKQCCALDKCSASAADVLRLFFRTRLLGYLKGLDDNFDLPADPKYAGALFEFKNAVGERRDGKTYKQALFSPAATQEEVDYDTVAGRAAYLMRDIAREITCASRAQKIEISQSLDMPREYGDSETPLRDLVEGAVPDAAFMSWLRQVAEAAEQEAAQLYAQCGERERWVLHARAVGVSLTDEGLQRAAGLKKSALFDTARKLDERVSGQLKIDYPDENPEDFAVLLRATLVALVSLASEETGGTFPKASLKLVE